MLKLRNIIMAIKKAPTTSIYYHAIAPNNFILPISTNLRTNRPLMKVGVYTIKSHTLETHYVVSSGCMVTQSNL